MKQKFFEAEIIDIIDVNNAVKRFFIKVPHVKSFDFKPGQFVMINLPIQSKISYRSYSIASAPDGTNVFELIIVLNPPGLGTPYMWQNFKVGSTIQVAGPLGKFTLPDTIKHDICFICTGTGIAPLRSMLHHIYNTNMHHHRIYFIFGSRKKEDLLYKQELEALQAAHSEFNYIPVLSRETPENWSGKIGYVHAVYEEIFRNKREAHFYLCGWTAMLKEARERLALMGYSKEHIKFENYD
jgi:CDP-4-dehydro-6-deoxyglucose reductase